MAKRNITAIVLLVVAALAFIAIFYKNKRAQIEKESPDPPIIKREEPLLPMETKSSENSKNGINETSLPLSIAPGFKISIFARGLPSARVIQEDTMGNIWVSQTREGKISLIETKDGLASEKIEILKNLNNPHGLAFDPENPFDLYFAEENKISIVRTYTEDTPHKLIDLPSGGRHYTRTLLFGPDKKLYVSIGSTCDTCVEKDARIAKIYSLEKDGSSFSEFASGLRNSVFMAINPNDNKIWATEMGRDFLGDNLPPDEINIIEKGKNYGWPYCYGNKVYDSNFDPGNTKKDFCASTVAPQIEIPAHSAPLGLAFIPDTPDWPENYRNNLLIAYHGSWNRRVPTGYKIVRYQLDKEGRVVGQEDFITGWLGQDGKVYGRPVDIIARPNGQILISDDKEGLIYKVERAE